MGERLTGHVELVRRGVWRLVVNLPAAGAAGTRRYPRKTRTVQAGGKREAERLLSAWLADLEQYACTDPDALTLGEVLQRWLAWLPDNVRPKTEERYRELAERHLIPDIGHTIVATLDDTALYAYYRRKAESGRLDGQGGLSSQTCRHLHATIRAALNWALERHMIRENPALRVKHPPKQGKRKTAVWDEGMQARAVDEARGTSLHIPAVLGGWVGLRRSEICALRWGSVDLDGAGIAVTESVEQTGAGLHFGEAKTDRAHRVLPIPRQAVEILREHKRAQDEMRLALGAAWNARGLVYCRRNGLPVNPDTLTSAWRQFVRQHRLEPAISLHGLRRSYVSRLHDLGAPDGLVQQWAGHADMRTTHAHYVVTFSARELQVIQEVEERIEAARAVGEVRRIRTGFARGTTGRRAGAPKDAREWPANGGEGGIRTPEPGEPD